MAKKDIVDAINRALFGGPFAEDVLYNDICIKAIVEIGEELERLEAYFKEAARTAKSSNNAKFTVSAYDVLSPKPGDIIMYEGQKWVVDKILLLDSMGGNYTLAASCNSRGYIR